MSKKIVYCIPSIVSIGGLNRILINKVNYLADVYGYDVVIITRNMNNRKSSFPVSDKVSIYDVKVKPIRKENLFIKVWTYIIHIWQYYNQVRDILTAIHADVAISVFSVEMYFLFLINDGSKKIVESHGARYFWSGYPTKGLNKIFRRSMNILYPHILRKYDQFVVLTNEDKKAWPELNNVVVIPNFIQSNESEYSQLNIKKVVSVGRLVDGKRFDQLIKAWKIVSEEFPYWKLEIVGEGSLRHKLEKLIDDLNLNDVISLSGISHNVIYKYLSSSIFVLASDHEGLPMVLLEAMSVGLPLVSYDCPCGPKDLISNGINGYLVEKGNYHDLANKLKILIKNPLLLEQMSLHNLELVKKYSPESIMKRWSTLFINL